MTNKSYEELREKIAEFIEDIRLFNSRNEVGSDEKAVDNILALIAEEVEKLKSYVSQRAEQVDAHEFVGYRKQDVLDLLGGGGK